MELSSTPKSKKAVSEQRPEAQSPGQHPVDNLSTSDDPEDEPHSPRFNQPQSVFVQRLSGRPFGKGLIIFTVFFVLATLASNIALWVELSGIKSDEVSADQFNALQGTVQMLSTQLQQLQATNTQQQSQVTTLQSQVTNLQSQVTNLQSTTAQNQTVTTQRLDVLQQQTTNQTFQLSVLNQRINELLADPFQNDTNGRFDILHELILAEIATAEAEIEQIEQQVSGVQNVTSSVAAQLKLFSINTTSALAVHTSDISELASQVATLFSAVSDGQGNVSSIYSLFGRVGVLEGDVTALTSDTAGLTGSVTALHSDIGALNTNVSTLETQIGTLTASGLSTSSSVTTLQNTVTSLQSTLVDLQTIDAQFFTLTNLTRANLDSVVLQFLVFANETLSHLDLLDTQSSQLTASFDDRVPPACATQCLNGGVVRTSDCTCTCTVGWTGSACQVSQSCAALCAIYPDRCACVHGAVNSTCGCTCVVGWTGAACDVVDATASQSAIASVVSSKLAVLISTPAPATNYSSISNSYTATSVLQSSIGRSAWSFARQITNTQLLSFNYDLSDYSKQWFRPYGRKIGERVAVADELEFTVIGGTPHSGNINGEVHLSVDSLTQSILAQRSEFALPGPSIISRLGNGAIGFRALISSAFPGDQFYTRHTTNWPYYHLSLPTNTATQERRYSLNPAFWDLVLTLPPYSSASQATYFSVLDTIGDSLVIEAEEGGWLEMWNTFSQRAIDSVGGAQITTNFIEEYSNQAFQRFLGQDYDSLNYYAQVNVGSAVYCSGGGVGSSFFNCTQTSMQQILNTFSDDPRATRYRTMPISQILPSNQPLLRQWWQNAELDWYNFNANNTNTASKSCPTCSTGSCAATHTYCSCTGTNVGRVCNYNTGTASSALANNPIQGVDAGSTNAACPAGTAVTSILLNWSGTCNTQCNADGNVLKRATVTCTPFVAARVS